jgi:hypothetical protein
VVKKMGRVTSFFRKVGLSLWEKVEAKLVSLGNTVMQGDAQMKLKEEEKKRLDQLDDLLSDLDTLTLRTPLGQELEIVKLLWRTIFRRDKPINASEVDRCIDNLRLYRQDLRLGKDSQTSHRTLRNVVDPPHKRDPAIRKELQAILHFSMIEDLNEQFRERPSLSKLVQIVSLLWKDRLPSVSLPLDPLLHTFLCKESHHVSVSEEDLNTISLLNRVLLLSRNALKKNSREKPLSDVYNELLSGNENYPSLLQQEAGLVQFIRMPNFKATDLLQCYALTTSKGPFPGVILLPDPILPVSSFCALAYSPSGCGES